MHQFGAFKKQMGSHAPHLVPALGRAAHEGACVPAVRRTHACLFSTALFAAALIASLITTLIAALAATASRLLIAVVLVAHAACLACFLGSEFVGGAGLMGGATAFRGNLALALRVHGGEAAVAGVALLAAATAALAATLIAALLALIAALLGIGHFCISLSNRSKSDIPQPATRVVRRFRPGMSAW
jgi:hypothetical protein